LRNAQEVGIPLLAGEERGRHPGPVPRVLEDPAVPAMTIGRDPNGIVATPTVVLEGRRVPVGGRELLGSPAHGICLRTPEELLIGPLERPLSEVEQGLF